MGNIIMDWIDSHSEKIPTHYFNNWTGPIYKYINRLDEICGVPKIDCLFLGYHKRITIYSGGSTVEFPALGFLAEGKVTLIYFHPTGGIVGAFKDIHKEYAKKTVAAADIVANTGRHTSRSKEFYIIFDIEISSEVNSLYREFFEECKKHLPGESNSYRKNTLEKAPIMSAPVASSGGCYIATAVYGSYDCPQVWTLRRYRDNRLRATWLGRVFVKCYYAVSPLMVKLFGRTKWFNSFWRKVLDKKVSKLKSKGFDDTPYRDGI